MPIPIKNDPQLLGNCQNHMSVSDTRLQYATDPRHKIIRISLGARQTKATLTRKGNTSQILTAECTQVFAVPSLLLSATQHLLDHFLVIPSSIPRMALFEGIPMFLEYLAESPPVNSPYLLPPCSRSTYLSTMSRLISLRKNAKSYTLEICKNKHISYCRSALTYDIFPIVSKPQS